MITLSLSGTPEILGQVIWNINGWASSKLLSAEPCNLDISAQMENNFRYSPTEYIYIYIYIYLFLHTPEIHPTNLLPLIFFVFLHKFFAKKKF